MTHAAAEPTSRPDPFDVEGFQSQPRVAGLAVAPDGRRAVIGVSTPDPDGARFVGALWSVDPAGDTPAHRLTRSAEGESAPVLTPAGDVLFLSSRPAPGPDPDPATGLWLLPAGGGEARPVVVRPGGVLAAAVARGSGTVVVAASTLPGSADEAADAADVRERRTGKVSAILHTGVPVRFWDHDLGPGAPRLFAAAPDPAAPDGPWVLRDLTGPVGRALDEAAFDVVPDGTVVVTEWRVAEPGGGQRTTVAVVDLATGTVRTLAADDDHEHGSPRVSPDGTTVALLRERRTTPTLTPTSEVALVPLAGGPVRVLTEGWDAWPHTVRWSADGASLVVAADHRGRLPLFRVDVADGAPVRLTPDDGAYPEFAPLPGGDVLALRQAVDSPPAPVVVGTEGARRPLAGPVPEAPPVPGSLREVTATAADGTALRAWLALPAGAGPDRPAPLVLWVHGGPLSTWNGWSWRWNPWLLTARGYAVLLPDPALSTGYGPEMLERGWGRWGAEPYTDLMTVTDAALADPALDAGRTAAMGGSFGGYMANWIAGHTDRFAAIVTHASLWNLETFGATTDAPWYWRHELTPEAARENSPHRHVDAITTPVLVVHGDRDHRVPIGEALALWWALNERAGDPATSPHRFLYYPDENHWVLSPGNARAWYDTVLAFLDQHVLGHDPVRPARLG